MKKLSSITLQFENLDWVRIPREYIRFIAIEKADELDGYRIGDLFRYQANTNRFLLSLNSTIDADGEQFEGEWFKKEDGLVERLTWNAISSVYFEYSDGTEEEYITPWEDDGDNEYCNRLQKVAVQDDGSVSITIEESPFEVGLFFHVGGVFFLHGCSLQNAEAYGDFLIYNDSHANVWNTRYFTKYGKDYDYFPRGRVAYRKKNGIFQILYDHCLDGEIGMLAELYAGKNTEWGHDEHYQCHICNPLYVE